MHPFKQFHSSTQTHPRLLRLLLVAALIAGLAATAWPTLLVHASSITVNTTDDELNTDGDCSLREAIRAANRDIAVDACPAGSGADTIIVPAGTYLLTLGGMFEDDDLAGDLDIKRDLTIQGSGPFNTTINANNLDRVFDIFMNTTDTSVKISNLTIRGGFPGTDVGSGIRVLAGALTLERVRVMDNTGGTAIFVYSTLDVSNSRIENNTGQGAIFNNHDAITTITNTTISGNSADTSAGGISNYGNLTLVNSTVSGNSTNSSGGGIYNLGIADLYNVTISNNTSNADLLGSAEGGGIDNFDFTGVYANVLTATNTIIAGNFDLSSTGGTQTDDCWGRLTSGGHNLIQQTFGCTILGTTTGNILGLVPDLGPLQNNGGAGFTHALLAGSAAIDGAPVGGCRDQNNNALITDQRGYLRPVDGNGDGVDGCDIGAYEYNSPGTPIPSFTPFPQPTTRTPTPSHTTTATLAPATSTPTPTATATATPFPDPHWVFMPEIQR